MKQPLPLKTAFKLKGFVKKIDEELLKYEDVRKDILIRHGMKNPNGTVAIKNGTVQFEGDGMKNFIKDINELTSIDIELGTISLKEIGDDIRLTTEDLTALDGFLVD